MTDAPERLIVEPSTICDGYVGDMRLRYESGNALYVRVDVHAAQVRQASAVADAARKLIIKLAIKDHGVIGITSILKNHATDAFMEMYDLRNALYELDGEYQGKVNEP